MATTITYQGGNTITPSLVTIDTFDMATEPRTVVHDILDGPPVHTLRPAAPLTGTLQLLFRTEQAATDCMRSHRVPALFTVASTDRPVLNFDYVVTGGAITLTIDAETASHWIVGVPFQGVT